MKRLLILLIFGMMGSCLAGCHFWECLWRGPACQQCPPPAVTYGAPCQPAAPCNTCAGAPVVTPGPETYVPAPTR
jgi:hypothetical protein